METMRVSLLQTNIVWEDKTENLRLIREKLEKISGETDVVVLPEMFSTGFSMNSETLAEPVTGPTVSTLQQYAKDFDIAITGSFVAEENRKYYNRGFFITPGQDTYFYDKRHLFRMGNEIHHFAPGAERLIIPYRGWNICLLVCYDLRFPVWSRNADNEYDLLIYVANWPAARRKVWDALLPARAIENQCYVCGVNRVGIDGNHLAYDGGSAVYTAKGEVLAKATDNEDTVVTTSISLPALRSFREKFPVWKDADTFRFGK